MRQFFQNNRISQLSNIILNGWSKQKDHAPVLKHTLSENVKLTFFVVMSFQLLQGFFVLFVFFTSFWDFGSVKGRDGS